MDIISYSKAKKAESKADNVQNQLDQAVADGDQLAETQQARVDADDVTHITLKDRIDSDVGNLQREITGVAAGAEGAMFAGTGEVDDLFEPPRQDGINSYFSGGDAFAVGDVTTFNEYKNLFESLWEENSSYITRHSKGFDSSGWREWVYYVYGPENFSKTVIIGAGMHGGEKLGVVTLYNFLKLLIEKWRDYPQLAYVRKHVRLVVMPLQNPAGIYFNSRTSEGVDINRNFDYKWEEYSTESEAHNKGEYPASQFETQCIVQVMEEYQDSIAYIDMHNMSTDDRNFSEVVYVPKKLKYPLSDLMLTVKELSGKSNVEVLGSDNPSGVNYATDKLGMISTNIEYVPGQQDGSPYGESDMTYALKWYGNLIIRFCKYSSKIWDAEIYTRASVKSWFAQSYNDGIKIPSESGYEIVLNDINGVLPVNFNGYIKVSYEMTVSRQDNDNPGVLLRFTPVVFQRYGASEFTDDVSEQRKWFEKYVHVTHQDSLTVSALIPINKFDGHVEYKLYARADNDEYRIMRLTRFVELTPSEGQISAIVGSH